MSEDDVNNMVVVTEYAALAVEYARLQQENAELKAQLEVLTEEKSILSKMYELCGNALETAKATVSEGEHPAYVQAVEDRNEWHKRYLQLKAEHGRELEKAHEAGRQEGVREAIQEGQYEEKRLEELYSEPVNKDFADLYHAMSLGAGKAWRRMRALLPATPTNDSGGGGEEGE